MAVFIFLYSIMVYGVANMLVYFNGPFNIIDRFRNWVGKIHPTFEELFSCMFCLPTNIGLLLSIISCFSGIPLTPFTLIYVNSGILFNLFLIFLDGLYAGGITYLIHTIQQKLENNG